ASRELQQLCQRIQQLEQRLRNLRTIFARFPRQQLKPAWRGQDRPAIRHAGCVLVSLVVFSAVHQLLGGLVMKETRITLPELILVAGTRAALGAGLGLLLADRLAADQRRAIGWTLFLVGAVSTVPLAFEVLSDHHRTAPAEWRGTDHERVSIR